MRAFFWGALGKSMMGIVSSEMLRIGLAVILSVSAMKLYNKAKSS